MPDLVKGNWIPAGLPKTGGVIFIAEKPSLRFVHNEKLRKLGNFNVSSSDRKLQEFIRKYLRHSVYITDMVKTEGKAGSDFVLDWLSEPKHKRRISFELKECNARVVVCLSKKVLLLFQSEFPKYETFYLHHPAYVYRYKEFEAWERQFKALALRMNISR